MQRLLNDEAMEITPGYRDCEQSLLAHYSPPPTSTLLLLLPSLFFPSNRPRPTQSFLSLQYLLAAAAAATPFYLWAPKIPSSQDTSKSSLSLPIRPVNQLEEETTPPPPPSSLPPLHTPMCKALGSSSTTSMVVLYSGGCSFSLLLPCRSL